MIARVSQFPVIEGKDKRHRPPMSPFVKLAAEFEAMCPNALPLVRDILESMLAERKAEAGAR